MTIEIKKPDLYTVLGRRRKTVVEFLEEQNVDSDETLNEWVKSAYGSWQISDIFLEEARAFFKKSSPVKATAATVVAVVTHIAEEIKPEKKNSITVTVNEVKEVEEKDSSMEEATPPTAPKARKTKQTEQTE